jgi:hypothetical protein
VPYRSPECTKALGQLLRVWEQFPALVEQVRSTPELHEFVKVAVAVSLHHGLKSRNRFLRLVEDWSVFVWTL